MDPYQLLPKVNVDAPREKPDNTLPPLRRIPIPEKSKAKGVATTPLVGKIPAFRPVYGMPAIQPNSHLAPLAFIG